MLTFHDKTNFELYIMDLMNKYRNKLRSAECVERFSNDLHQFIEIAITDMLDDGFNGIDRNDYEDQY